MVDIFQTYGIIGLSYLLIVFLVGLFYKYPYYAILATFFFRPIIDMFWWAKSEGAVSPLYIVGVLIPVLAFIQRKSICQNIAINKYDIFIVGYLLLYGFITLIKIIKSPTFVYNSIDSFARVCSVMAFYFVGKYYFILEESRRHLVLVILYSTFVPFSLTALQEFGGSIGLINLTQFSDVAADKMFLGDIDTGSFSAFYLEGRHDLKRISGPYEGVYELAFLGLFATIISFNTMYIKRKFNLVMLLFLFFGIYYLYFTYSRSAWSLFVASLVVYSIFWRKYNLLFLLVFSVFILYYLIPNVQYRYEDELNFFLGRSDFNRFGYGRGGKWLVLLDGFRAQSFVDKFFGNYGIGNPENQFLNTMFHFGYFGLFLLLCLFIYLSFVLVSETFNCRLVPCFDSSFKILFLSIIICSFWIAGHGNGFNTMISVQWVLWTWIGILLNSRSHKFSYNSLVPFKKRFYKDHKGKRMWI